jgi:hypothetical protein
MDARYLLCIALLLCTTLCVGQNAVQDCRPTTPVNLQSRTALKHRQPSTVRPQQTTVAEILNWAQPNRLWSKQLRESDDAIDERENQSYAVEGNLWRIVLEGNDCDLHLEVSDISKGASATRIIAEIPQEQDAARRQIISLLLPRDRNRLLNQYPNAKGNYRPINLKTPIRVKLVGYAFFDAHHYTTHWKTSKGGHCGFTPEEVRQRGSDHGTCYVGTIWELHPVCKVE